MTLLGNKSLILLLLLSVPASAKELDLASFKEAKLLWLGSTSGMLAPLAEEVVLATSGNGKIEFFKKDGEQVGAREIWALKDRDKLEQRDKSFALAEKQLEYDTNDLDEKYKSEAKKHQDTIKKLEEQIRELILSKRLPEASKFDKEIDEAVASLKKEVADASRKYKMNYNSEKLIFEKDKLRQALNKKRLELCSFREEKQHESSISGRLEYLLPQIRFLQGSDTRAKFKAGDQIAIIRDDSQMHVIIPQASFPVTLHKNKSYLARVSAESGAAFTAYYHDKVTQQEGGKLVIHYRFRVRNVDLATARAGSGQKVIANISETYKQKVFIVPKADLLHHNAQLIQEKGWTVAALTLWPDCEVLSEGAGALALVKKGGNEVMESDNEN